MTEKGDSTLFPPSVVVRPESVVLGRDRDVIPTLLAIHALPDPMILDATYNRGVTAFENPHTVAALHRYNVGPDWTRAEVVDLSKKLDVETHRVKNLATALGDLLVALGGATKGQPLTGPQLLLLAYDATEHFTANPPKNGTDR